MIRKIFWKQCLMCGIQFIIHLMFFFPGQHFIKINTRLLLFQFRSIVKEVFTLKWFLFLKQIHHTWVQGYPWAILLWWSGLFPPRWACFGLSIAHSIFISLWIGWWLLQTGLICMILNIIIVRIISINRTRLLLKSFLLLFFNLFFLLLNELIPVLFRLTWDHLHALKLLRLCQSLFV